MPQVPKHRMGTPRSAGLSKGTAALAHHRGAPPVKNGQRLVAAGAPTRSSRSRFLKLLPRGDNVADITPRALLAPPTRPATPKTILPPPIKRPQAAVAPAPKRLLLVPKKPPTARPSPLPPSSAFETLPAPPETLFPSARTPAPLDPSTLPAWLKNVLPSIKPPDLTSPTESAPTMPLSNLERERLFGKFTFKATPAPNDAERILVNAAWVRSNIVTQNFLALKGVQNVPFRGVDLHRLVMPHFAELIDAWADAKLLPKILTWNGGYVPRFRRGQADKRVLSSHSWGSAFDINARWNPFRKLPATAKMEGSVQELAVIAKRLGWIWGGNFHSQDGMHFEAGPSLFGHNKEPLMSDPTEKKTDEASEEDEAEMADIDAKLDALITKVPTEPPTEIA